MLLACTARLERPRPEPFEPAPSLFETVFQRARSGDPAAQNLVGFMLFTGEGAPSDPTAARFWLELAAEAGDPSAQVSLAVMYELGAGVPRDREQALRYLQMASHNPSRPVSLRVRSLGQLVEDACAVPDDPDPEGPEVFATFCAGCHGTNGLAAYVNAPSFALGERLEKSHAELYQTVLAGHGDMPAWSEKLPRTWLSSAVHHARALQYEFRSATVHVLRSPPERYFRFGPMDVVLNPQAPREPSVGIEAPVPPLDQFCPTR